MRGYGTESSSDISQTRREALLADMQAVQKRLEEELTDFHAARLHTVKRDSGERITDAINADIKDFLGELRDAAETLRRGPAFVAPVNESGRAAKPPRFEKLSCLVDRSHTRSLIGQLDNGLIAPQQKTMGKTGAAKRNLSLIHI